MSALTPIIGIASFTSGIISKVTTSRKVEIKVLKDSAGSFSSAAMLDPTGSFSVSGFGDYPSITIGVTSANLPSTLSGGIIVITSFKKTEKNDDWQSWEYSGDHYPNAT